MASFMKLAPGGVPLTGGASASAEIMTGASMNWP